MVGPSFDSASTTNCLKLSYMVGSKKARSWNLIGLPNIYFNTWRLKNIGHNSFCNKHNPNNLKVEKRKNSGSLSEGNISK